MKLLKVSLAALVLLVSCFYSYSVAEPVKEEVTISDDGAVEVPLDFTFPFYDKILLHHSCSVMV